MIQKYEVQIQADKLVKFSNKIYILPLNHQQMHLLYHNHMLHQRDPGEKKNQLFLKYFQKRIKDQQLTQPTLGRGGTQMSMVSKEVGSLYIIYKCIYLLNS